MSAAAVGGAAITLDEAITALVAEKRAVGYKFGDEARVLARFAGFCRAEFPGLEAPDRACVEAWIASARRRGVSAATLAGLAAPVRELARWLGRRGVPAYVLPPRTLRKPPRYVPHIYTDAELAALFAQTDRCHYSSEVPFRHLVMPVLFRLIYACGLRVSEARLLRAGDVDLVAGVLTVRGAKGGKDRLVPVSGPMLARLAAYWASVCGRTGSDWFFPGTGGRPLTSVNIYHNFRRFLWQARISHGGRGHGPRVHDLRHTAAVHVIRRWFIAGEDIGALLPALQAYFGHDSISDTDYYIRLTADTYPHLISQVEAVIGDLVPALPQGQAGHGN